MKPLSLILSLILVTVSLIGCTDSNVTKLKREVQSINAMCPISGGISGDFLSIKYNEKDKNVYMYIASNEQFGSLFFLKENRENMLANLKLMLQNDNSREMLKDMVNAKAGLVITYKMPSNGKTARFEISYEELKELKDNPTSEHDRNIIILQNKIANDNNRCPYEIEPGVKAVKTAWVDDNIVYYCQVDEDVYNFKEWKTASSEIRSNIEASFKELRGDPTMQSEIQMLKEEGVGYHYRYFGSKSKDYFDIIFTPEELSSYLLNSQN